MEQGGSFIVGFRPGQVVFIGIKGNFCSCYTVICLTLSFLGFGIDAFAAVTRLVAIDATVAAFAVERSGRFRGALSFLVAGSVWGLGLGCGVLLCVRVPPSSFAGIRARAFAFASAASSFAFGGWSAAFAFAALISALSFSALKGDGVVCQGRVFVAQSAELEVRVFREAGKCV